MTYVSGVLVLIALFYVVQLIRRKRAGASLTGAARATVQEDYHGRDQDVAAVEDDRARQAAPPLRVPADAVALIPAALEANDGDRVRVIQDLRASYPGLTLREAKRLVDAAR